MCNHLPLDENVSDCSSKHHRRCYCRRRRRRRGGHRLCVVAFGIHSHSTVEC